MLKKIIGLSVVASISMATAAFAQGTPPGGSNPPNQSNPSGLGASMNVDFSPAGGCCSKREYDYGNADGNAKRLASHFSQKLAAMQLAIIEAMKLSTGQLSGNLREQVGADHSLADQQDDRGVVKSIETVRMDVIRDAQSGANACSTLSGSRGGGTESSAREYSRQLAIEIQKYITGQDGPAKNGQAAAMVARVDAHCKYATEQDVQLGVCKSVGKLPDADIDAASSVFYKKNGIVSTYSKEHEEAAMHFVLNTFGSSTITPLAPETIHHPTEVQKYASNMTYSGRASVATDYATNFISDRKAQKDGDLVNWTKSMAKQMVGFQNADFDENGVSRHDWMKFITTNFLLDTNTLAACDETPTSAIKCIKNMTAAQTYMQYEQYAITEKIGFILASMLSIMNDNTRKDIIRH